VPGIPEEESVARRGQGQTGTRRTAPRNQRRVRDRDDVISVLARTVREVEAAAQRGPVTPAVRTKFQGVALLLREEHARVRAEQSSSDTHRAEQLKRLDGIATILAKTAVRDSGLLALLAEDAVVSDAAKSLKRDMLRAVGVEPPPEEAPRTERVSAPAFSERRVVPQSVVSRPLANPFLAPDFEAARPKTVRRAVWPVGSCSARSSARSSAPAAEPQPAWPCPRRPRCAPRVAGSSCRTRHR
jgi:hypothetical protein